LTPVIVVKNWERFQHYKDRDPPWVKLYRDILSAESWVLGTDTSRLLQLAIIMLAARYGNRIPLQWNLIRKVASFDFDAVAFETALSHLVAQNFVEIQSVTETGEAVVQSASNVLALTRSREAEESRGREEAEESRETMSAARTRGSPADDPDLDRVKAVYPKRNGSNPWPKARSAINARLAEGATWSEMHDGAARYAAWCQATGKLNTEHVMQAARFFGPGKEYLSPWDLPATKAEARTQSNVQAFQQAKERLFGASA
jgi:hypothetical protein